MTWVGEYRRRGRGFKHLEVAVHTHRGDGSHAAAVGHRCHLEVRYRLQLEALMTNVR